MFRFAVAFVVSLAPLSFCFAQDKPPAWADAFEKALLAEIAQKKIPSITIAVVDGQKTIWSKTLGFADRNGTKPATAETIYRVGGVSNLFTDIAVMQLVQEGKLELDADVAKYLPDFKPANASGKPITLRFLMSHRSGLFRDPPIGSYYDPTEPSLEKTGASLNGQPLAFEPGENFKYSNSAGAVVGRVLEKIEGMPFAQIVQTRVLDKIGMKNSSFLGTEKMVQNRAEGQMWTYHGRTFPAPTFALGVAPSCGLYSNAEDMAKFLKVAIKEGEGLMKPDWWKMMLHPEYRNSKVPSSFGLGFLLDDLDGHASVRSTGAVYGFSTELIFLPEEKLGAVVIASKDRIYNWTERVAAYTLKAILAEREKKPMPAFETTQALGNATARAWEGRYTHGKSTLEFRACEDRLMYFPAQSGTWMELRKEENDYVVDDVLCYEPRFQRERNAFRLEGELYEKEPESLTPPPLPPKEFLGLIGEYGWDHNVLNIFEKDGQLWCNLGWFYLYPLAKETESVFKFPNANVDEKIVFEREPTGKAKSAIVAGVKFDRRRLDGEDGKTFKVEVVRPVAELEPIAKAAAPPPEKKEFRKSELVELAKLDATLKFDLRYATANNFLGTRVYPANAKGYMQKPAAEAVVRVQKKLKEKGLGLIIFDPYRPWYVTKIFWDAVPPQFHNFVADPSQGSRHNRGCAVDLGLCDLKTGKYIDTVSGYDEFSDRAYPNYIGGTTRQRWYRDLLRKVMESEGFTVYEDEWWHYDFKDWKQYSIGNQTFESLAK